MEQILAADKEARCLPVEPVFVPCCLVKYPYWNEAPMDSRRCSCVRTYVQWDAAPNQLLRTECCLTYCMVSSLQYRTATPDGMKVRCDSSSYLKYTVLLMPATARKGKGLLTLPDWYALVSFAQPSHPRWSQPRRTRPSS